MGLKFQAYSRLLGPELHRRISSPAEYLGWHTATVVARGGHPWDTAKNITVRVNHGRWLADCFWCGTGMLTRPDWGVAYCAECGARYNRRALDFPPPPDRRRLERALLVRVRRDQQNWTNAQTVEALELENNRPDVITPGDLPEPGRGDHPGNRTSPARAEPGED